MKIHMAMKHGKRQQKHGTGEQKMAKRCSNSKHCGIDMQAINRCSIFIVKCHKKKHHVLYPFWSGWLCKDWRAEDGK